MRFIENYHEIGDVVYLKTDNDQYERIVTGYYVRPSAITYGLTQGTEESWHYDFEITVEKHYFESSQRK